MRIGIKLKQSNISIKIIGVILIVIGLIFLADPTSLNLKIGFSSILIGILIVFVITSKITTDKIIDKIIKGNIETIEKIIKELDLNGNAIIIPKTENLTEEKIIILTENTKNTEIPNIKNEYVFLKGKKNKNLGIAIPPSGLQLLNDIEKEEKFKITTIEDIDKKLQIFVGMDLVKSISFKPGQDFWVLEIQKPIFCPKNFSLCKQYPCPTCSAILIAIIRAMNNPDLRLIIKDANQNRSKTTFHLKFIKRKQIQSG